MRKVNDISKLEEIYGDLNLYIQDEDGNIFEVCGVEPHKKGLILKPSIKPENLKTIFRGE